MNILARQQAPATPVHRRRRPKWDRVALLMVLPYLVYLGFFVLYPLCMAIAGSVSDWNILTGEMKFRGLFYYNRLVGDGKFYRSLKNTVVYILVQLPPSVIIGLFLAVLLDQRIRLRAIFRTVFFVPVVTPVVVLSVVWSFMYQDKGGLLNVLLEMVGLEGIRWLTSEAWSMPSVGIMKIWTDVGFYAVLLLAALQAIPSDLVDAAHVDGANAWQTFRHVRFPLLNPTMVFSLVIGTIGGMQVFAEPFLMTYGGPAGSSTSLALYLYEEGFIYSRLGYACAIGIATGIIILIITLIQRRVVEREIAF